MKKLFSLALGVVFFALASSTSSAQILLSVQFKDPAGTAQAGFQTFALSGSTGLNSPSNNFTDSASDLLNVTLLGSSVQSRSSTVLSNGTQFTNANLLNSFGAQPNHTDTLTVGDSGATTLPTKNTLQITGLSANTSYQIQIWSADTRNNSNRNAYNWWYDTTAGFGSSAVLIGGIQNATVSTFPQPPDTTASNNLYSVIGLVNTNSLGQLLLGDVASYGSTGQINGFTLSVAPVPEPSTYALMLGGLAVLALALRRQRRI